MKDERTRAPARPPSVFGGSLIVPQRLDRLALNFEQHRGSSGPGSSGLEWLLGDHLGSTAITAGKAQKSHGRSFARGFFCAFRLKAGRYFCTPGRKWRYGYCQNGFGVGVRVGVAVGGVVERTRKFATV